jgi:DNA-binding transcriptional MerR regulator
MHVRLPLLKALPEPPHVDACSSSVGISGVGIGAGAMLQVGELARECGKTVRAIHLYEELGLLTPQGRSKGRYRLYASSAVVRIRWIGKLQDMGFSLTDIQSLVRDWDDGRSATHTMAKMRELYAKKLAETQAHIRRLKDLEREIVSSIDYLDTCDVCDPERLVASCTSCEHRPRARVRLQRRRERSNAYPIVLGRHRERRGIRPTAHGDAFGVPHDHRPRSRRTREIPMTSLTFPIFMDYHSTTPCDRRVVDEMLPYFTEKFGNAASRNHSFGWVAEEAVDVARERVAKLIGAQSEKEIVFTSGATESNNLALKGVAEFYKEKGNHIVTTVFEHKAVLDTCKRLESEGFEVTYLPIERDGRVSVEALEKALTEKTILVSVMLANNERSRGLVASCFTPTRSKASARPRSTSKS